MTTEPTVRDPVRPALGRSERRPAQDAGGADTGSAEAGRGRRPIRALSEPVAAQIAAGEVIERPAAVLKELLENAVDAGARRITVEIVQAGRERIGVHDDGAGIPQGELALACMRHATSKLTDAADLMRVRSYGFRGEALPAIAAAAGRFILTSRPRGAAAAAIEYELGRAQPLRPAARAEGTTVEVIDLFRGQPARRAFLAGERSERAALARACSDLVLAQPALALRLEIDGRRVLAHEPPPDALTGRAVDGAVDLSAVRERLLREAAAAAFSADAAQRAIWLEAHSERAQLALDGLAGDPRDARGSRDRLRLFVNDRPIHDRRLSFAVQEAYQGWLGAGRFPLAVVRIEVPPDAVDVNVHPAKTEVKLKDPAAAFSLVGRSIREALSRQHAAQPRRLSVLGGRRPDLEYADDAPAAAGVAQVEPASDEPLLPERRTSSLRALPRARSRPLAVAESTPAGSMRSESMRADVDARPNQGAPRSGPLGLPPLRMVGQLHRTFIIAEGPDGLVLVDQHAAHERVVYERILDARRRGAAPAQQPLLDPLLVSLDAEQAANWKLAAAELEALGFDADPFGARVLRLRALPGFCTATDAERIVRAVLDDLSGQADTEPERFDRAAASAACHGAIRRGQALDPPAMAALLRDLEQTRHPHACPHGRPTLIEIAADDVLREFGRK